MNRLNSKLLTALLLAGISIPSHAEAQSSDDIFEAHAQGAKKNRKEQDRPIKLGTSGGNTKDRTLFPEEFSITCCSGTLGALVEKNGLLHILSNNHVLARSNLAKKREPISQPGYLDHEPVCQIPDESQIVAHLSAYKKLKYGGVKKNKVDAAIAKIVAGSVDPSGRILRIGLPGTTPLDPAIGMEVKKSGRTTGLTHGVVRFVGATANVTYEKGCGTDVERTARLVNQFVVEGKRKKFSKSGDSGSMIYQDVDHCPSPVGLLFAGNADFSFANPIKEVQKQMAKKRPKGDVNFVGCSNTQTASAQTPDPDTTATQSASTQDESQLLMEDPDMKFAARVLARRRNQLMSDLDVVGIALGLSLIGPAEPVIAILARRDRPDTWSKLPESIEGVRTEIIPTDPIVAFCSQGPDNAPDERRSPSR